MVHLPSSKAWTGHLLDRVDQAKQIGLLSQNAKPDSTLAQIFAPPELSPAVLEQANPEQSMRSLLGSVPIESGWSRRPSLIPEVANWIFENYSAKGTGHLVCEAGYQDAGDKVLEGRPHFIHHGRPFLQIELSLATLSVVSQILKWGVSWRFLGVIARFNETQALQMEVEYGDFLCDALDCDTMILCPLAH